MEISSDPQLADVVVIYLLNIGKALLVDKRRRGDDGPLVTVCPQEELLLEGRPVKPPVTPRVVQAIERRQVLPSEPDVMHSYLKQLMKHIKAKVASLRPDFPPLRHIFISPHFAPVLALAQSEAWQTLLEEFEDMAEDEALDEAAQAIDDLYAWEILYPERFKREELATLRHDFQRQHLYQRYKL